MFAQELASLSAESRLLICCAQVQMSLRSEEQAKAIINGQLQNWESLIHEAQTHGVAQMLAFNLARIAPEAVPPAIDSALKHLQRTTVVFNLQRVARLKELYTILQAQQINVLIYKGSTLAQLAYGQLLLRPFNDIDMLVPTADLDRTKDALLAHEYEIMHKPETDRHGRVYQGYDLFHAKTKVVIDLQDRFGIRHSAFATNFDELWARRQPINVGGVEIPTLSNEDYLLVLCAHGTQHRWIQLKWVSDIAELLRVSPQLDWQAVMTRASAHDAERMLYVGLLLADQCFGITVPANIRAAMTEDRALPPLVADVLKWMFQPVKTLSEMLRFQYFTFNFDLKLRKQLRHKVGNMLFLIRRRLTPNLSDTNSLHLPKPLSFLYYLYRPIRILKEHHVNET